MKHSTITETNLIEISLEDCVIHPENPRSVIVEADQTALEDSIDMLGIFQNLVGVKMDDGKIGIVAGGRRLRAAKSLSKDGRRIVRPLVHIAKDIDEARLMAVAENDVRTEPHVADQIVAFKLFAKQAKPIEEIAQCIGATPARAKKIGALINLPKRVIDALREDKIDLTVARAFAMSQDPKRIKAVLEAVLSGEVYANARSVKNALAGEAVSGTSRPARFVGVEAYIEAGGQVMTDLFEDTVYLTDEKLLNELVSAKIDEECKRLVSEGWAWAEFTDEQYRYNVGDDFKGIGLNPVPGELTDKQAERLEEYENREWGAEYTDKEEADRSNLESILEGEFSADQKAVSGVLVFVDSNGKLEHLTGLVKDEERAKAVEAGVLGVEKPVKERKAEKPEYNNALHTDFAAINLAALQTALLSKPELLLDLLAYGLSDASGTHADILAFTPNPRKNDTNAEDQGLTRDPRIVSPDRSWSGKHKSVANHKTAFVKFQKQGKKARNETLTTGLARLVCADDSKLFEHLVEVTGSTKRKVWTPSEAFFKRLTAAKLSEIMCFVQDWKADSIDALQFAKCKKGEKVAKISELFQPAFAASCDDKKMLARIANWTP